MKKLRLATLSIIVVMLAVAMQSCCNSEESLEKYKGWRVYDIKEEGRGYITVTIDSAGKMKKVYTKTFFKTKYPVGSIIGEAAAVADTQDQADVQPIENESEPETTQE